MPLINVTSQCTSTTFIFHIHSRAMMEHCLSMEIERVGKSLYDITIVMASSLKRCRLCNLHQSHHNLCHQGLKQMPKLLFLLQDPLKKSGLIRLMTISDYFHLDLIIKSPDLDILHDGRFSNVHKYHCTAVLIELLVVRKGDLIRI